MFILLTAFLIMVIAVNADIILYKYLKTLKGPVKKYFGIFSFCSFLYSVIFVTVYGTNMVYFHDMRWAVFIFILLNIPRLIFLIYWLLVVFPFSKIKKSQYEINMVIGLGIQTVTAVLILYGGFIGRTRLQVKEIPLVMERLPEAFDGLRIVQFSDFHLGSFGKNPRFVQQVVDRINELEPDIIFFTGDLVNDRSVELDPFLDVIAQLKTPPFGIYSVLGNHDYGDYYDWGHPIEKEKNFERLLEIEGNWGWILLNNEYRYIHKDGDSIAIVGVENWGDPPFQQYGDLEAAYEPVDKNKFAILLSHNPIHWREEVLPTTGIDLMLAGHTHAFQLRFGNLSPAAIRYPEWAGLYRHGDQYMYVNVGVGNTFYPMRIGAFPEITLLELTSQPEEE